MHVVYFTSFLGLDVGRHCRDLDGFTFAAHTDLAAFEAAADEADVLMMSSPHYTAALARGLAARAAKPRLIQFTSSGYETAERHGVPAGIPVANARSAWAPSVAEHTVAMLLALLRQLPLLERERAARIWSGRRLMPLLQTLEGMRVGILGYGTIGEEIARRLQPFGCGIVGIARAARPGGPYAERVVGIGALATLLPDLDVLIATIPSSAATDGLIDGAMLDRLKPSAFFLNIGRGQTVDEGALCDRLAAKRLAGAALDVFDTEPLPADHPFWGLENLLLSPHVAGFGGDAGVRRVLDLCRDNLVNIRDGRPLLNPVTLA